MELNEYVPLSTRGLVAAQALLAYLWKMLVPLNLMPFYQYPLNVSLLSVDYFLPIVLVIGLTTVFTVVVRKEKLWLAVWFYYTVTLIPVLGIVQVGGQSMADRYTYLPSIGPFVITGLSVVWIYEKLGTSKKWGVRLKNGVKVTVAITLALILYSTLQQNIL